MDDRQEKTYIVRTLRSTAVVTAFVVFMLASYRQTWAIAPLLIGVMLAVVLLVGMERFVRTIFSPAAVLAARKKGRDRRWALLGFALVKYPLVALLIGAIVRAWASEPRRIMAFVGGFILLQVVIGLRAAGRALTGPVKE